MAQPVASGDQSVDVGAADSTCLITQAGPEDVGESAWTGGADGADRGVDVCGATLFAVDCGEGFGSVVGVVV
jgi:hypothetical protein